jgi:hypothetical protein
MYEFEITNIVGACPILTLISKETYEYFNQQLTGFTICTTDDAMKCNISKDEMYLYYIHKPIFGSSIIPKLASEYITEFKNIHPNKEFNIKEMTYERHDTLTNKWPLYYVKCIISHN